MYFCWHVIGMNGEPYPCLWADAPSEESHSPYKTIVRQKHLLTDADADLSINDLAKKYPYNRPTPIDDSHRVVIIQEVVENSV